MEKQRKTFLSYSRTNKDFAVKLARELKAEGFPVWLDQLDIPPGSRWDVEVEKALMESDIFMVIITKASSTSENVLDEIGYAIDNGKRMLPVLLEKTNIPLRLRRFQYVDFTDKSFDEGVQSAKELLRNLIAQATMPRPDVAGKTGEPSKSEAGAAGKDSSSRTDLLRRENLEQELRFKEEEARLKQEKEQLEKQLLEERTTQERMQAVAAASQKSRTRRMGIFGVALLAVLVAGFLITRFLGSPPAGQTEDGPTPGSTSLVVPVTASTRTPTEEEPTPTREPTATTAPTETEVPADTATPTSDVPPTPSSLITDDMGVEMVLVPEDEFTMGADGTRGDPYERPEHTVFLDAFYIDKYEVTNKRYQECVDEGACLEPYHDYFTDTSPNRKYYGNPEKDNFPVIYVDWDMAKAYCDWRGARLPTEAEWEKAARGTQGYRYAWGNDISCQNANYASCGFFQTTAVGTYPDGVSPYGAYDMTGNVWEWVNDYYAENYYSISPGRNPKGPLSGQSRVVRGGAWNKETNEIYTYDRVRWGETYNTWDIGIRCASSLAP